MAAEPTISDVLQAIRGLEVRFEARLDMMDARLDKMESRLDGLDARVVGIEDYLKAQPDMRLMFANSKVTLDKIIAIESEIRMLRSAINDHARENVTPGEMDAVHHDLAVIQREQLVSATRLQRIETILKLEPSTL